MRHMPLPFASIRIEYPFLHTIPLCIMRFQEKDIRKIKLIIWDLDDTFWKGTLSDNGNDATVVPITGNIQLVKALTRRGIINSICSKNDALTAKAELERQGWHLSSSSPLSTGHQRASASNA